VLPGASSVLLLDHEVTELSTDGSARRVVTIVDKALTEQGRDALTQYPLPGGPRKLVYAYSLSPTGERQDATSTTKNVIRFRKLEVGSTIVVQYFWYQRPGAFLPGHFADGWMFQSIGRQHERSTWIVVTPKERPLKFTVSPGVLHEQRDFDGRVLHVFAAEHVPPQLAEPLMPPVADVLLQASVTTLPQWDEYVRWERGLLLDAFRPSTELSKLAQQLAEGAKTPAEKLDRLFEFAVRKIRYQQDYETTIAGVRPHPAPVVLERGYGDCKDKAVLLIRLGRELGLQMKFAILRTTSVGAVLKDIPNQQFNHAIVYVPAQAGIPSARFIDPTSDGLDLGNLRPDDQGALSLVLDPDSGAFEFVPIPYQSPELSYEHDSIDVQVKGEQASGKITMELKGAQAMQWRHLLRNRAQAEKIIEHVAAALLAGATVQAMDSSDSEDIDQPLRITATVDASGAVQAHDNGHRLAFEFPFALQRSSMLDKRTTDLVLGVPSAAHLRLRLLLPEGEHATHLPADFEVKDDCFTAKRATRRDGGAIEVELDLVHSCPKVALQHYADYRRAVQKVSGMMQDQIIYAPVAARR
jgi:hypothetical protein